MNLPSWFLPFDNAAAKLFALLGISANVIFLWLIATTLKSWLDAAKDVSKAAQGIGRLSRKMGRVLIAMPRVKALVSVATVIAAVALQALTALLCFLGGNYFAILASPKRQAEINQVIQRESYSLLYPSHLARVVHLDVISGTYLVLAVMLMLLSYQWAKDPRKEGRLGVAANILAAPAIAIGFLAAIATVFIGVILLFMLVLLLLLGALGGDVDLSDFWQSLRALLPVAVLAAISFAYSYACHAAMRASKIVVRIWE